MGKGINKVVRVIFIGNKVQCPECSIMGNFTQIRLHLKMTHKYKDTEFIRNRSGRVCYMCGLEFSNVKEVSKHIMNMH